MNSKINPAPERHNEKIYGYKKPEQLELKIELALLRYTALLEKGKKWCIYAGEKKPIPKCN